MTTKIAPAIEFHLFIEEDSGPTRPGSFGSGHATSNSTAGPLPLVLTQGPARLAWDAAQPALLPVTGAELAEFGLGPWLEPVAGRGSHQRLLLVTEPTRPARVNGLRAPRVTLLNAGDRLHFDDSCTFRVAIYYRPRLEIVSSTLSGIACPICTIPLKEGDHCFLCPCGTPLHLAEDESAEQALACARMAVECPRCLRPIQMTPGYHDSSSIQS